jgi:hypothetical protein
MTWRNFEMMPDYKVMRYPKGSGSGKEAIGIVDQAPRDVIWWRCCGKKENRLLMKAANESRCGSCRTRVGFISVKRLACLSLMKLFVAEEMCNCHGYRSSKVQVA